jgi:antirestriction protein ArdC
MSQCAPRQNVARSNRADVYTSVTDRIINDLERGVRPWLKPWNAEHAAGRISRPLRFNGERYSGINVLTLWAEAESRWSRAKPFGRTTRGR